MAPARVSTHRSPRRMLRLSLALLATVCGAAVASEELLTLEPGQGAIVFMIDGQGRAGELQVRDGKQPAPVWASVLAPASVRQFTVRPGSYAVVLAPARKTIDVAVSSGRATVVALVGTAPDGGYVWREQSDVTPSELEQTGVPLFIVERRLAPASYAPTSLDARGAGLTFVLRADF